MTKKELRVLRAVNAGHTIDNDRRFQVAVLISEGCLSYENEQLAMTEFGREQLHQYTMEPQWLEDWDPMDSIA